MKFGYNLQLSLPVPPFPTNTWKFMSVLSVFREEKQNLILMASGECICNLNMM